MLHSFEEEATQDENAAAAKLLREMGYEPKWQLKGPCVIWVKKEDKHDQNKHRNLK